MGTVRVFRVRRTLAAFWFALFAIAPCWAQEAAIPPPASIAQTATASAGPHSAEALYLQLRSVELDPARVYRIRGASLDRAAMHIALDDGTIAFTQDVAGRITGAFFEGDGEVLLVPPDQSERASMTLFTGAAILEERFVTAYFRFNDDTFAELRPSLRPTDEAGEFITHWNASARNLADADALRLLLSFSQFLPVSGQVQPKKPGSLTSDSDHILHVRLQGRKLGVFDLYFDSNAREEISAGQLRTVGDATYYDMWTSFSLTPHQKRPEELNTVIAQQGIGEQARTDSINISGYKIRTEVRPPTQLNSDATLQLQVREGGQRALVFELSRFLQIKQVEADGRPVEFIHNQAVEGTQLSRRGNDLLAVIFPQPLQAGQELSLHFVYGGAVLSEAGAGLLYVGARGVWYPNRGLAMSNFDLEFRYPAGWTLIATGMLSEMLTPSTPENNEANATPRMQASRWVSGRPIPVAGFNLGKYSRVVARAGSVTVEAYATASVERSFPKAPPEAITPLPAIPPRKSRQETTPIFETPLPPSPARNAQPVADISARAVEFFARRFGPFPYRDLALTQMPGRLSQGWPGLIFLSSLSFLTPEEREQLHWNAVESTLSAQVIAHETAHQWWGDLLTWSGYRDQWTMEALANYSSLMLLESENPAQFRMVMEAYRDTLLRENENKEKSPLTMAGPVTFGARLSNSHFPDGYEAITYGRGTWLFHMLRHMMSDDRISSDQKSSDQMSSVQMSNDQKSNDQKKRITSLSRSSTKSSTIQSEDEPFVRALRRLRDRYEGKSVTTLEILQVFEEELPPSLWYEGKKSLDWFYQGWVGGTDIPRLELQGVKYVEKPGSTVVTGTILQKSASKKLVTSVPVYAALPGKTVLLGRVFADGPETPFHLSAPPGTRRILLDPYQTVLSRVH